MEAKGQSSATSASLKKAGMTVIEPEKWLVALSMNKKNVLNQFLLVDEETRQLKYTPNCVLVDRRVIMTLAKRSFQIKR